MAGARNPNRIVRNRVHRAVDLANLHALIIDSGSSRGSLETQQGQSKNDESHNLLFGLLFGHVAAAIAQPVFPGAPSRIHAVRRTLHDGLDLMQLTLADLEQLDD